MSTNNEHTQNLIEKTIEEYPMFLRLKFIGTQLEKLHADDKDDLIDWQSINHILRAKHEKYDFNNFGSINTIEDFNKVVDICMTAPTINKSAFWQMHKCKECNNRFGMTYNEVKFYEGKKLDIPRRCPDCRAKRKALIEKMKSENSEG